MKRLFYLLGMVLIVGILASCGSQSEATNKQEKLQVIATFYPMYDFTKEVVGEEGEVALLIPAGTDSHDYEPSAKDMAKIQNADVFVYNNENMETWVPAIQETLKDGNVLSIKATEGMLWLAGEDHDHNHDHDHDGHSHELDPHVWLAPNLAMKQVAIIRDQLIEQYPDKKDAFTKNTEKYLEKLQTLHQNYQDTLKQAKQKTFVTQHAAFNYLALEYGLNQVAIAGLSTSEEPSAARIAELKQFVQEHGIKYIYFEENAKDSIAKTLANEAGVSLAVLNPLEGLTKEQLANGENYLSIMQANLKSLQKTTETENPLESTLVPEKEKTVYNGYFEDSAVKDRALSDWNGDWQTVDTYLEDGTLDPVFEYKAKTSSKMTAKEYKEYYKIGYQTDIEKIKITGNTMAFTFKNGETKQSDYQYVGKQILNYSAGNRGVRYLFEAKDLSSGAYRYVQFSDHSIAPTNSDHFHIYLGNESQETLLEEMNNWPTFYPEEMSGKEIAQEMILH
ncbi:zinc ABC transporter substrate-binding protein AdcA [Enterococcus villorum]|uniref:Zinc ABC transporter substrate-binding protein AdcA n=2 Tax=Enterococcus villorum TaxID=112904 RepID=A0A511J487_9ENTE|nr:zinc ABC transporter substrate-binding protein AdcA [Enterococcus villorum]EOH92077.1 periplasmic solute binding protein [Enterococcus villorum ATCC 700913]EOW76573.1 periplasmic solute binding protein [Enterococcus villorum ATCC 700913]GEL92827.1 zinc ABC transporter substrate-binding protein AdcA [Enterococcus villorum]